MQWIAPPPASTQKAIDWSTAAWKLDLPARQGAEAELPSAPARRVHPEQRQALRLAARPHLRGGRIVGPVQLDGAEPRRRGGVDAVEQGTVRPQKAEVGREAGHGVDTSNGMDRRNAVSAADAAAEFVLDMGANDLVHG